VWKLIVSSRKAFGETVFESPDHLLSERFRKRLLKKVEDVYYVKVKPRLGVLEVDDVLA
jgi:hypothetical protein